jgi:hypothetical protein
MSKSDPELSERLSAAGATELERRLLEAAGREQPSRELSERMARAIGVSLPAVGSGVVTKHPAQQGAGPGAAAPNATTGSLVAWVTGTVVTGVLVIGAFVALRPKAEPVATPRSVPSANAASSGVNVLPQPPAEEPKSEPSAPAAEASTTPRPLVSAPQTSRERPASNDLSEQLALVDSAHGALTRGDAAGALSLARKYAAVYPSGTFRPEAAAIRIEALVKLGRMTEARTLASKFAASYGPGPLADRVATLVGSSTH